ncbi:YfhD family protein [Marinicrinis sediminis]|uniref:YfhD family protein n=1 Tax=Marinicrinis sediminis TaxID=1652465 RepID=A0ABW5RCJ1_9BACL
MNAKRPAGQATQEQKLPISKNEDVEFSMDQADAADLEALKRADAADKRQEEG